MDTILNTANDLKYTRAIQSKLGDWMAAPAEEFVRILSADLLGAKRFTPAVRDQFTVITKLAFEQFIGERINERLKGAMAPQSVTMVDAKPVPLEVVEQPSIEAAIVSTSAEELEGFHIVRSIVRDLLQSKRVVMRDAQSYCAVLLDDNNRKPICRLRFNNSQKLKLGLFNLQKEEYQVSLESLDDIYTHADQIRATVGVLLGGGAE